MRRQIPALTCAAMIIFVAIASQAGMLSQSAALFLILVLPAIFWPVIAPRRGCACKSMEG